MKQVALSLFLFVFLEGVAIALPNNIRSSTGIYKKPGGGFCIVNLRPTQAPHFIKVSKKSSLHNRNNRNEIFKSVPKCNSEETKVFKQTAKKSYLQNQPRPHKTALGSSLLYAGKMLGIGCAFASAFRLAIDLAVWDSIKTGFQSITSAQSLCIDCLRQDKLKDFSLGENSQTEDSFESSKTKLAKEAVEHQIKTKLQTALIEHEEEQILEEQLKKARRQEEALKKRLQVLDQEIKSLREQENQEKLVYSKSKKNLDKYKDRIKIIKKDESSGPVYAVVGATTLAVGATSVVAIRHAKSAIKAYEIAKQKWQNTSQKIAKNIQLKESLKKSIEKTKNLTLIKKAAGTEAYKRVFGQNLSAVQILARLPLETGRQILKGFSFLAGQIFSKAFALQMTGSILCDGPTMYLINEIKNPEVDI